MKLIRRSDDETTDVIQHHWNERAATYDSIPAHWWLSDEQHRSWREVVARAAGSAHQRVLDVACGTGFLSLILAELGHSVTGVDFSEQMLATAREKAKEMNLNIDFRVENAESLNDRDGTYDLVMARHVIWTLPDPARAIREWLRVLRPGGRIALIEGKWWPRHHRSMRSAVAEMAYGSLDVISRCVPPKLRTRLVGGLYARWWLHVENRLPFSEGPSADDVVELLKAHGVHDVTVEPIMSPQLWGGTTPRYPRYVASGRL